MLGKLLKCVIQNPCGICILIWLPLLRAVTLHNNRHKLHAILFRKGHKRRMRHGSVARLATDHIILLITAARFITVDHLMMIQKLASEDLAGFSLIR